MVRRKNKMLENLILAIILTIICLVMCWKPVPIAGIPISILTVFICMTVFLFDDTLPANPYFTVLIAIIAVSAMIVNGLKVK